MRQVLKHQIEIICEAQWQSFAQKFGKLKMVCSTLAHGEKRRQQWELSRLSESQLKASLAESTWPIFTSISHTENIVLAVGLGRSPGSEPVLGIGVDLERRTRAISQAVYERLVSFAERDFEKKDLGALDFWVIKEACFKANPLNRGTVISYYQVTQWDPRTKSGKAEIDQFEILFHLVTAGEWKVALALAVGFRV